MWRILARRQSALGDAKRQDAVDASEGTGAAAWKRPLARGVLALVVMAAAAVGWSGPAQGQEKMAPSRTYYLVFDAYYDGEYVDALKEFKAEGRGAIKTAASHWIDSICYHTMCGECYYQMGQLDQALTHYDSALKLYLAFSDWMLRMQFSPTLRPQSSGQSPVTPWGTSKRQTRPAHFPQKVLIGQGNINNNNKLKTGGVVTPPILYPITPHEIVRCTVLAMRRRYELMGPVCQHDPMTNELITTLARRPAPPNHWSEAWIDLQLGLAYLSGGKIAQAKAALNRSLLVGGEYDHPLTSTALLEMGKLALVEQNFAVATELLAEASYAAYRSEDMGTPDIIEEALRYGLIAHLMSNDKNPYPPLEQAATWARRERLEQLQTSCNLMAAESLAVLGRMREAANMLDTARSIMGRQDMASGKIGARHQFLSALVNYQQGRIAAGDEALATAMNFQRKGSHWMFQIGLSDKLFSDGALRDRTAMDLFTEVLRDPMAWDWAADPMEALSVLMIPHPLPYEHWFEVAIRRKEHERALEITDLAKRHRFFSTLGMGGRLLGLRWTLEAPDAELTKEAILQRQKLLARFPAYEGMSQAAEKIREGLGRMPLVADPEGDGQLQQKNALEHLARISAEQEALLRVIGVRREAAPLAFPPVLSTKELQESLPEGHAMLVFFSTSRYVYAFYIGAKKYEHWNVGAPAAIHKGVAKLLREMGHFQSNRALSVSDLKNDEWKKTARELLEGIAGGVKLQIMDDVEELVIVPDGSLWYTPFEALDFDNGEEFIPLITRKRLRYAPFASLAVPDGRPRKPSGNTAVVVGRMFPGESLERTQEAFGQLAQAVPGAVALQGTLPGPSAVYSSVFDRMIVLDEVIPDSGPYDWAPARLDRGTAGSNVSAWMGLPWQGPDQVLLPGFVTVAGDSLRGSNIQAAGAEMFLSVCGMMATGTRTILLSRWRTGGQSSFDLVREFAQELPFTTASDAWQRSVLLLADSRFDPDLEPRVDRSTLNDAPKAEHPFFWAGYMVIDSGIENQPPEKKDQADVAAGGGN